MSHRLSRASILILSVTLTGCASGTQPPPSGGNETSPRPPVSIPPEATPPAPPPSVAEPPPTSGALPVGGTPVPGEDIFARHDAPELESLLPGLIAEIPLVRYSIAGRDVVTPGSEDALGSLLAETGGAFESLSFASAFDPTGRVRAAVTAFRVEGADEQTLLSAFATLRQLALGVGAQIGDAQLGGYTVKTVSITTAEGDVTQYLLGHGDVVIMVEPADAETAGLILESLP